MNLTDALAYFANYKTNTGTILYDVSPFAVADANVQGAVPWTNDRYQRGMTFNGVDANFLLIDAANRGNVNLHVGSFTLAWKMKPAEKSGVSSVIFADTPDNSSGCFIIIDQNGVSFNNAAAYITFDCGVVGKDQTFVIRYDSVDQTMEMIVDGVSIRVANNVINPTSAVGKDMTFGKNVIGGGFKSFNGILRAFSIYQRALTDAELSLIFDGVELW